MVVVSAIPVSHHLPLTVLVQSILCPSSRNHRETRNLARLGTVRDKILSTALSLFLHGFIEPGDTLSFQEPDGALESGPTNILMDRVLYFG
jgi:hypothetical protein